MDRVQPGDGEEGGPDQEVQGPTPARETDEGEGADDHRQGRRHRLEDEVDPSAHGGGPARCETHGHTEEGDGHEKEPDPRHRGVPDVGNPLRPGVGGLSRHSPGPSHRAMEPIRTSSSTMGLVT